MKIKIIVFAKILIISSFLSSETFDLETDLTWLDYKKKFSRFSDACLIIVAAYIKIDI